MKNTAGNQDSPKTTIKKLQALKRAVEQTQKKSNQAVLKLAKILRETGLDGRIRKYRVAEILDEFKGSVAVDIYQRAEMRNARLGASECVLVKI